MCVSVYEYVCVSVCECVCVCVHTTKACAGDEVKLNSF